MNRRQFVTGAMAAGTTTIAGCGGSNDTQAASPENSEPAAEDQSTAEEPASGLVTATLETSMGDVAVDLYGNRAPRTVENFVGLATGTRAWNDPETGDRVDGEPLYKDVLVHRVIDGFMIQTGDPTGTGRGGPGYQFADEFHEDLRHDGPGVLSMANSGPDTNGSQFFITLAATPHLDDRHSVFGQVTDGMSVVRAIGAVETDTNDRPVDPVVLESVAVDR
jgi:peptidyl-prolyl cis-trans isomerase A (cyclophilin A)